MVTSIFCVLTNLATWSSIRHGAELLFQVLTEREEKNSVAIARCLCAAIVDRLTFNGTIIETGTDSYRLAQTRARTGTPSAG
jgi:hypothetical protein